MSDREIETKKRGGADESTTRDIGGAYGGQDGTMPDANEHVQPRADDASGGLLRSRTSEPQRGEYEASETGIGTAHRDATSQQEGTNWPGDTAPDREFQDNPPERGGDTGSTANDAF